QENRFGGIHDGHGFGPMLERLFEEQLDVVARGEPDEPKVVAQILSDFDRAGANRAGAAEQDNVLHARPLSMDLTACVREKASSPHPSPPKEESETTPELSTFGGSVDELFRGNLSLPLSPASQG